MGKKGGGGGRHFKKINAWAFYFFEMGCMLHTTNSIVEGAL
jgi:hypothetical protein